MRIPEICSRVWLKILLTRLIGDWRVRPLVVVVKMWAKRHDINSARYNTLSSYGLCLMVINFLQCGVQPPVLPCLQELYPVGVTSAWKLLVASNYR